ncbi:MAG TPA: heat-inducible transcriptional repressor HrcA [Clostridia bacterium]|nr:heat-inducible transcriptional repressor HrcA [Clostridia bacterium]
MIMDERKKRILQAIIDDYIDTAEPIGSRTIARKHELGLSSATIRNEMADLEEMGYLAQPHTSAGRVPSDKGYRIYVDELMQVRELEIDEIEKIKSAMELRINELSQLIRQASAVLSRFTRYTSMVITPQMKTSTIKAIQVVPIESGKAMVIVVTNAGIVRNILVKISESVAPDVLIMVSNALNNKLAGLTIEQVDLRIIRELEKELGMSGELLLPILSGAADCINQIDNAEVYVEGTTNIFNHPEFRDMVKARDFMNLLDERTGICKALFDAIHFEGINVRIGSENDLTSIRDCSLITTNYNIADTYIGTIGVIGPTRMDYPRVISSMKYVRKLMGEEINRLLGYEPPGDG